MKKVNLGCGTTIAPGWINIDISLNITLSKIPLLKYVLFKCYLIDKTIYENWPRGIIRRDVTKGLPFESKSIDYIYTSHLLEHLERSGAQRLLAECHRVLKNDGWIRIVVPDLKLVAMQYLKGTINADQFSQFFHLFKAERKKSIVESFFPWFFAKDIHKWMYDLELLSNLLISAGFQKVEKRKFQEGNVPDIKTLDNRPEESLYLEARK